jgi:hypothetical protein
MALTTEKRAAVTGDEKYVVRIYSDEAAAGGAGEPVVTVEVYKKKFDQLSGGEKTAVAAYVIESALAALSYSS